MDYPLCSLPLRSTPRSLWFGGVRRSNWEWEQMGYVIACSMTGTTKLVSDQKIVNEIVKRTKRPLQSAPHNGNFPPGDVRVHAGPRQGHSKRRMISGTLIAPPAPYIRSDLRPKDLHAYGWPKRSMPTSYDIQKIHQVRGRR